MLGEPGLLIIIIRTVSVPTAVAGSHVYIGCLVLYTLHKLYMIILSCITCVMYRALDTLTMYIKKCPLVKYILSIIAINQKNVVLIELMDPVDTFSMLL